jgi:hypothetical protein
MEIDRLRRPGGPLGVLSVVSACALMVLGVVGVVAMLVTLTAGTDQEFLSVTGDELIALVLFAVTLAGAFGFYIEDRAPGLGAALVVAGGVAISLVVFWLVFPIVIGVGVSIVALLRAWVLHRGATGRAPSAA